MALGLAFAGCTHAPQGTRSPLLEAAQQTPASDLSQLDPKALDADPSRAPEQELAALHVLYDLLDRARFAQDDRARDLLWSVLVPKDKRRGAQAVHDAAFALLNRAWDLENRMQRSVPNKTWSDAQKESLAQLIMLLSLDANNNVSTDQVQTLALGLRTLLSDARSEISDNLWWRIYDFDLALVRAIVDAPSHQRRTLLRYGALLVDDPEAEPSTSPSTLQRWIAPWQQARNALREDPRWSATLRSRDPQDNILYERLTLIVPVPRRIEWKLPVVDGADLAPDPLSSLLRLEEKQAYIDGQRLPHQDAEALAQALASHLALVGRDTATLAADRMTPAPLLHRSFQALAKSGLQELLVAGHPRDAAPPPEGYHAQLMGVPVGFAQKLDESALYIAAFADTYRIGWSQAMLPEVFTSLNELSVWISRYRFSYPISTRAQIAFAQELSSEQRIDLLTALYRGLSPQTQLLVVTAETPAPTLWPDSPSLSDDLVHRARWRWPRGQSAPSPELKTIAGQEPSTSAVAAAHALTQDLFPCFTRLDRTKIKRNKISAQLRFSQGALASWQWSGSAANRIGAQATARVRACFERVGSTVVLDDHRQTWTVEVTWTLPPSATGRRR